MPAMVQNIVPESLRPPNGAVSESLVMDITALQNRLAKTESEIVALRQSIQSQPQAETNAQSAAALAALQQRLATLETRPVQTVTGVGSNGINAEAVTALGNAAANQAQQLASVTARIATVEAALGNTVQLETMSGRVDALEERSADAAAVLALAARITQVEATANTLVNEQTGAIGLLLAASQLREAVANGRPFGLELDTIQAFAAKQPRLTIDATGLATHQRDGVPTRVELRNQFDQIAPSVVRAGLLPTDSASWFQRTLDRFLSVVNIRRLDDDGSAAVGAIVTRIEDRLSNGDIEAAIVAVENLNGLAAETLAPWLSNAKIISAAERSVTALVSQAIGQMNVGRDIAPTSGEASE